MKEAHVNCVSVAIFAWAQLEPQEGVYDFGWLGRIIGQLYENGIYTILATPTGARPAWMAQKYPEVLRVDSSLHRNHMGERHNHCYTSPVYREKTRQINVRPVSYTHLDVYKRQAFRPRQASVHEPLRKALFRFAYSPLCPANPARAGLPADFSLAFKIALPPEPSA